MTKKKEKQIIKAASQHSLRDAKFLFSHDMDFFRERFNSLIESESTATDFLCNLAAVGFFLHMSNQESAADSVFTIAERFSVWRGAWKAK